MGLYGLGSVGIVFNSLKIMALIGGRTINQFYADFGEFDLYGAILQDYGKDLSISRWVQMLMISIFSAHKLRENT